MRSRKEIKRTARELLGHNIFGDKWLYMLIAVLLASLFASFVSSFGIGIILVGAIMIGYHRMLLAVARRQDEKADIAKLITGFTDDKLGDNIILGLLHTLFVFLWSLLFIIPGIVKSYSYAMCYYIKIDHPEMEANDCITESRRLMRGHKWQLFVLDLSFLGWYIVGLLCLGIGTLWVDPYHELAKAEFYRSLIGESVDAEVK